MNERNIGLAASVAVFLFSSFADALEILHTHVDDRGNLLLDVADEPPPVPMLNYHARARAAATYVCADVSGEPNDHRMTRTIHPTVEEAATLPVGAGGLRGTMTLRLPRERVNLVCPRGFTVQLASVVYSQIEVRNPFGRIAYARDDVRVFIRLER